MARRGSAPRDTFRNGQPSALAVDIIDLMDALKIEKAILAGFDWGARTADIVAALWPERVTGLVSVSGYLIGSQAAGKMPLPPKAELEWWYQFYFATERGREGYGKYRHEFSKLIWQLASPKWNFDDATFDRSAAAFDNPDHVDIVIHNYRWRLGLVQGEAKYDDLEKRLAEGPVITVPTITLEGDANGAPHPGARCLRQEVLGQIRAPNHHRRHRAQSATGGPAGLRPGGHRRRARLIVRRPCVDASAAEKIGTIGVASCTSSKRSCTRRRPGPPEGGRTALSRSLDGHLDVKLAAPGSARIGTNPEQLFATAWSACFESAIGLAAAQEEHDAAGRTGDRRRGGSHRCGWRLLASCAVQRQPAGCRARCRAKPGRRGTPRIVRTRKRRAATSTSRSSWSERSPRPTRRAP